MQHVENHSAWHRITEKMTAVPFTKKDKWLLEVTATLAVATCIFSALTLYTVLFR